MPEVFIIREGIDFTLHGSPNKVGVQPPLGNTIAAQMGIKQYKG